MFRYFDSTSQKWNKSLKSLRKVGKKANKKQKKRMETPEIFVGRVQEDEKTTRIDNPKAQLQVPKVLFFRLIYFSGINLKPSDNEDYLIVKSHGSTTFTVDGEERTRTCPHYVVPITYV